MKNTIKKRIVALSLIGAICIPTAAFAADSHLTGGIHAYYGAYDIHYAWADHSHYSVSARLVTDSKDTGWHSGWQSVETDNLYCTHATGYYKDCSTSKTAYL